MLILSNSSKLSQVGLLVGSVYLHTCICPHPSKPSLSYPHQPPYIPISTVSWRGGDQDKGRGVGRGVLGLHGNISPNWLSEAVQYKFLKNIPLVRCACLYGKFDFYVIV